MSPELREAFRNVSIKLSRVMNELHQLILVAEIEEVMDWVNNCDDEDDDEENNN